MLPAFLDPHPWPNQLEFSPSSTPVEGTSGFFLTRVRLDHQLAASREGGCRRNDLFRVDFKRQAFSTSSHHQLDWRGWVILLITLLFCIMNFGIMSSQEAGWTKFSPPTSPLTPLLPLPLFKPSWWPRMESGSYRERFFCLYFVN